MLIPGNRRFPDFDVVVLHFCRDVFDASSEVHLRSSLPVYMTCLFHAFSQNRI